MKNSKSNEVYLTSFRPRSYQLPLFDALENKGYKRVLAILPRRCLSGNSHIIMADGSFKLLKDIKHGDIILSWNGNSFEPDTVKHVWKTEEKDTCVMQSPCYPPLYASYDHVVANTQSGGKHVRWHPIKDLNRHASVLQYAGIHFGEINNPLEAEFWGYILSDGYVSGYQQPKFTNTNKELLDRVAYLATTLFDVKVIWRPKGNGYDLGFSNKTKGGGAFPNPIKQMFRNEGADVPKYERRLPTSIWNYDHESLVSFFAALIAADGNIYCHTKGFTARDSQRTIPPSIEITFSCGQSDNYAWDIYWLLRKIGIVPQKPYKEKQSNWKIKVAKTTSIKKLLSSLPIYGKQEAQAKALLLATQCTKETQNIYGCFRSRFSVKESSKEELYDLETVKNHNFVANGYLVHNSGKDLTAFNIAIRECLRKPCVIYYIFPTYAQGKKVLWDSITNTGIRILDYIPPQVIESKNSQEMKIRFKNGSLLQIVGSDNFDALMGTNPQGVVFSEYALQDPRAYQYIRPILTANNGWALFISTPRGKNHLYDLYRIAQENDDWFCYKLTLDDTQHIPLSEIERERSEGIMSEDLIQQEYYTSFTMGVEGSYYAKYLDKMRSNHQICTVPWENGYKVHTAWDLGVRDNTSIIFFQTIGQTVRIIDCYENSKVGLDHYAQLLQSKPYVYGKHIAPHDIKVKEFGSGMTRLEKARQLGISFIVANNISIMDGIESVRSALSKIYIDDYRCTPLIKALENYRAEYDIKHKIYKPHPLHDYASHFADAMRYLCISLPKTRDGLTAEELEKRYHEAMYGAAMPDFFFGK